MNEITISAELREKTGCKGELSKIRQSKKVPGTVYGNKQNPVSVTLDGKDIEAALKAGSNVIINLNLPGGSDKVIMKTVQRHVVSNDPIHMDLLRIDMKKPIDVVVPVRLQGESPLVKIMGAIVDHATRKLSLHALPADIPHEIVIDLAELHDDKHAITVADLKLAKGVTTKEEPTKILAHLIVPKEEEIAAPTTAAAAGTEAAQPEVIAKGKKEEEGAEGTAAAGKPGEKASAGKPGEKTAAKPEKK